MLLRSTFYKWKIKYLLILVVFCLLLNIFGIFTHLFEYDYYTSFRYPYEGDIDKSVLQLRAHEKPDVEPINMYNYKYITALQNKCGNDKLRLVFIVKSAPENLQRRITIRNTWGYEYRFSDVEIRTIFVVGIRKGLQQALTEEAGRYRDILQANFTDSYYNNTIKTMIGLKWAVQFCPRSKFYMLVDDDYYVSTKNVLLFVRDPLNYPSAAKNRIDIFNYDIPDDARLYAGYVFASAPHRHLTSKWYVSLNEYPYHLWPPYVTAGAVILSHEALIEMYYTSFYTQHFRFDDVYMGLVAKKAGIEPVHCNYFEFYKLNGGYRFTIAAHGYDYLQLEDVWSEQKSMGNA